MTALLLAVLLLTPPHPPGEQPTGMLTMLQGTLRLIRGTTVYRGVEGMPLRPGDILESSDGGFAQLEFPAGIIALGASSRLYVVSAGGTGGGRGIALDLILLSGWLKSETASGKGLVRVRTSLLAASTSGGAIVAHSNATGCETFLESGGPASISEVSSSGEAGSPTQAKPGQFFSRQKGAPVSIVARPSGAFLDAVPKEFRDTLPSRQVHVANKPVQPKADHAVSYEEIESWLTTPTAWRRGLAERFAPRLSDAGFRKQIESHVREFPEWEPLLHPKPSPETP
ncbi:MAG TPA: hypothetical protein VMH31_10840 [Methylomirabilota bacterium]|nr:hypothetical protein [Methylomirabilota bacterium]